MVKCKNTLYVFSSAWFVWRCCESEGNSVSVWGKPPNRWVYQFQFNAVKPSLTNYIYIIYKIGDCSPIMNIHWNTWKFHISRALLETITTITTITRYFPQNFQCYVASQVTVSTFLTDDWLTLQVNVSVAVSVRKLLIYDVIKVELNQSSLLFLYWLVGILSSQELLE